MFNRIFRSTTRRWIWKSKGTEVVFIKLFISVSWKVFPSASIEALHLHFSFSRVLYTGISVTLNIFEIDWLSLCYRFLEALPLCHIVCGLLFFEFKWEKNSAFAYFCLLLITPKRHHLETKTTFTRLVSIGEDVFLPHCTIEVWLIRLMVVNFCVNHEANL